MADAVKEKYGKIRKYIKKFIPILFATAIIFPGFYFQAAAAEEEQGETKSCEAEADNLLMRRVETAHFLLHLKS